nr:zinc finger BED domain-containing protein RICESLEEPER 2-like [Ipomoea batatas]
MGEFALGQLVGSPTRVPPGRSASSPTSWCMCPVAVFLQSEKATMAELGGGRRRSRVAGPGDCSAVPKLLLTEYFTSVGEKFKPIICENLKCKRTPMKWRDIGNEVDCGVYLMRHMESYVGERVTK